MTVVRESETESNAYFDERRERLLQVSDDTGRQRLIR